MATITPKEKFKESLINAQLSLNEELTLGAKLLDNIVDEAADELSEKLRTILSRPGKRVRSTIIYLIAKSGSNNPSTKRMALVGVAIELVHLASLVHDDIIDASQLRRGVSTAHAEWGNKMAVLLGDYLLAKSMELVVNEEERNIPMILSKSSSKLVEGEIKELDFIGSDNATVEQYLDIIQGKTASLLEACARSGAVLAGFNEQQIENCGKIGSDFGLAFQIIDDLLDFGIGKSNELGKTTFADLGNGVVTLPLLYYYDYCSKKEKEEMQILIAKANDKEIQKQIFEAFNAKGVFIKTQQKAMNYLDDALKLINTLPESNHMNQLKSIFETMAFRID